MRPQTDPARRCLPLRDWPAADRDAWQRATGGRDLLDEGRTHAAGWRPDTRHKNRRGYGRWLTFLVNAGIDLDQPPPQRITRAHVAAYLAELAAQQVSAYTRRNRIGELLTVARALWPGQDHGWLQQVLEALDQRAREDQQQPTIPLLSTEVCRRATAELRRLGACDQPDPVAFRDWLMLAVISLAPLRRRNFAALRIGETLRREPGGGWLIDLPAGSTKTGRPHLHPVTTEVVPFLSLYVDTLRPRLRPPPGETHLWLSVRGTPLAEHSIHTRLRELTTQAFGIAIGPHAFRHIFASSVSMLAPEQIDGARAALGHSSRLTTHRHYVHAAGINASRRHAAIIQRLRRSTRRRTTDEDDQS